MNLECLNGIITDNLAIHIDLTNIKSWKDWNTGLTAFSLTKWTGAISDNIYLYDFGLTGFDNGRTNAMWSGLSLTSNDTLFSMYKVGYNEVQNPTTGQTSGMTITTEYLPMSATSETGGTLNYFDLDGGYLQGFFKLDGFNYELLPARYNLGITIESVVYLYPESQGIFFMMGTRAEDKYNPYFTGETITGTTTFTGVTTSYDNYLDAITETQVLKSSFINPENEYTTVYTAATSSANTKNNVIAFELTQDKHLAYKYVDNNGLIITNSSPATITNTGFTIVAISFVPDDIITDPSMIDCYERRKGKLTFFINGRSVWTIKQFPEFYFKALLNDKEKQEGVSYSISWGGGSFGLKNSWHYDYQTYSLYAGQDTTYINDNFLVEADPIQTECYTPPTGDTYLSGLTLSADSSTFYIEDKCDPNITHPVTVMRVEYSGDTGITTGMTYFIKFLEPISVLSNRDYVFNLSLYNNGFFKTADESGNTIQNSVSLVTYSYDTDISILSDTEYKYPFTSADFAQLAQNNPNLHPIADKQEFEYLLDGIMYYGETGLPVIPSYILYMYDIYNPISNQISYGAIVSGVNSWIPMKTVLRSEENSGRKSIYVGLLIKTSHSFNTDVPLFVNNFTYTAPDILVQDPRKDNLLIQRNFDSSFIGGIQKLRIYDKALTSPEILHNALVEAKLLNSDGQNLRVSKGGRIIYR